MKVSVLAIELVAVGGLAVLAAGCSSSESYNVTISYVLEPTKQLPEGMTTLAVLDAGVEAGGSEDDDRARKWATMAADRMEEMIQTSAIEFGSGLTVAKRRDTKKVLAEQDLKFAGLVDGGAAAQAASLLNVQGIIASKLNIRVEVKEGKATTVDALSVAAWAGRYWGGGAGSISTKEVGEISRNMTVQCSFSLMDAASSEAFLQYSPEPYRKLDKASPGPVFGSSKGEEDLDSVDNIIGELVEQATREFVSMFVPCKVGYRYDLESSSNESSARGVLAVAADDYESAMQFFQAAVADDPDDHESLFCMGIVSELMGDWEGALKYYRRAVGTPGLDSEERQKYDAAKKRVAKHKDRIRKEEK